MDPDYDTGWAPGQGSCRVPLAGAALTACSGRGQGARIVSHAAELAATFVFDAHPANSKRGATAGLTLPAAVATPFVNGQASTGTLYVISFLFDPLVMCTGIVQLVGHGYRVGAATAHRSMLHAAHRCCDRRAGTLSWPEGYDAGRANPLSASATSLGILWQRPQHR
jgi:hypothetical protein